MTIFVTGGAGFIGSNFLHDWYATNDEPIVTLDKLTYAGNIRSLAPLQEHSNFTFIQGDIGDRRLLSKILNDYAPRAIIHFAAESHVDRSIHDPTQCVETNIMGSFYLLESTRQYWNKLESPIKNAFRYLHVSTDEVYGSLQADTPAFSEDSAYQPSSPYAASKAASDHIVRSYCQTYKMPVLITNCSNNYGPYQFPEKLIPLMIYKALRGEPLPVYGDGLNIRDWLYVGDHCAALRLILEKGGIGNTYNVGGNCEKTNLDIVHALCNILDTETPRKDGTSYGNLITFVKDRPGHDRRYAIDYTKLHRDLGWSPATDFDTGIRKTIHWYLENSEWVENVTSGTYREWNKKHYQTEI